MEFIRHNKLIGIIQMCKIYNMHVFVAFICIIPQRCLGVASVVSEILQRNMMDMKIY